MSDAELLDRANKALAVLENPIYAEAWENTRQSIIALIEKTPLSDTETAERLRICLKLLRDVRANLELMVNQGKIASFRLAEEKQRRENPLRHLFR
jgi:hypothetical protein